VRASALTDASWWLLLPLFNRRPARPGAAGAWPRRNPGEREGVPLPLTRQIRHPTMILSQRGGLLSVVYCTHSLCSVVHATAEKKAPLVHRGISSRCRAPSAPQVPRTTAVYLPRRDEPVPPNPKARSRLLLPPHGFRHVALVARFCRRHLF
jgi:hypothetical protein